MKEILVCAKLYPIRNKMSIIDNVLYIIDLSIIHKIRLYSKKYKAYSHNGVNQIIKYCRRYRSELQWWIQAPIQYLVMELMNNGTIWIKDDLNKTKKNLNL
jgi:hypothetical protein